MAALVPACPAGASSRGPLAMLRDGWTQQHWQHAEAARLGGGRAAQAHRLGPSGPHSMWRACTSCAVTAVASPGAHCPGALAGRDNRQPNLPRMPTPSNEYLITPQSPQQPLKIGVAGRAKVQACQGRDVCVCSGCYDVIGGRMTERAGQGL
jgi:hypothetical protein